MDTGVFKAHSLRGASTSKAFLKGVSVKEVVDHGKWSRESTWQKFYHKVVQSTSQKYQDKVLMLWRRVGTGTSWHKFPKGKIYAAQLVSERFSSEIKGPERSEIKFQFYEDETESDANGPPSLPTGMSTLIQVLLYQFRFLWFWISPVPMMIAQVSTIWTRTRQRVLHGYTTVYIIVVCFLDEAIIGQTGHSALATM